jgi:hypothetical protein
MGINSNGHIGSSSGGRAARREWKRWVVSVKRDALVALEFDVHFGLAEYVEWDEKVLDVFNEMMMMQNKTL